MTMEMSKIKMINKNISIEKLFFFCCCLKRNHNFYFSYISTINKWEIRIIIYGNLSPCAQIIMIHVSVLGLVLMYLSRCSVFCFMMWIFLSNLIGFTSWCALEHFTSSCPVESLDGKEKNKKWAIFFIVKENLNISFNKFRIFLFILREPCVEDEIFVNEKETKARGQLWKLKRFELKG